MSFLTGSSLAGAKSNVPKPEPFDALADAEELRRRIAQRGGEQSTILTGLLARGRADRAATKNVFTTKKNLGGTQRST